MKTFNLLSISLILITIMLTSDFTKAQDIKGDGNVVKVTRTAGSFDEIKLEGVVNLFLTQGSSEAITIESDKNIIPYIETKVEGNRLTIKNSQDVNIKKFTKLNVYVTVKDLKNISSDGVGNVKTESKLNLNDLTINSTGV